MKTLRLGLIGSNITESRSPALQIVCGLSVGLNVSYDLLIPDQQALSLEVILKRCRDVGFDGVNVTYPYKEAVLKYVNVGEPIITELGASNTVRFAASGATAWNTDYSGFIAAYRAKWGDVKPGRVLIIGTGGVGRSIAFAVAALGATEILLHDSETAKAKALAASVGGRVVGANTLNDLEDVEGILNCTPLGMVGHEGSALPVTVNGKPHWAFDAVYTPEHTLFRRQMENLGAEFLSGYELYFNQGIQGFKIFSGFEVTEHDWVRRTLAGQK